MRQAKAWFAAGALLLGAGAAQAGTIDTTSGWDGAFSVSAWGETGSSSAPTFGQTFTATNALGLSMTDFTFEIRNGLGFGTGPISYRAYVYHWTGSVVTGPALFTSGIQSIATGAAFQAVTIGTPGATLVDGTSYVAFLSTIGLGGSDGYGDWGSFRGNPYPGGKFVYSFNPLFASLSSNSWSTLGDTFELAFTMNFATAAVPLPSAACMGLVGLGLLAWRRRRLDGRSS